MSKAHKQKLYYGRPLDIRKYEGVRHCSLDYTDNLSETTNDIFLHNQHDISKHKILPISKEDCGIGFVPVSHTPNIRINPRSKRVLAILGNDIPVLSEKSIFHKEVGRVKISSKKHKTLVIVRTTMLPAYAFAMTALLLVLFISVNREDAKAQYEPEVVFKIGIDEEGVPLENYAPTFDTKMFNININATPQVVDGKINIRVVNNKEKNEFACVVKLYIIGVSSGNGELIEEYAEPIMVWESHLIQPGRYVENADLEIELASGWYIGRAMYSVYDSANSLVGEVAARLNIKVK